MLKHKKVVRQTQTLLHASRWRCPKQPQAQCALTCQQRWSRSRSGLRKQSTIFAEAGAGPGGGFLNENRSRSWSENFSFCRSRIINFIKFNFLWTANC